MLKCFFLTAVMFFVSFGCVYANECVIRDGAIEQVGIGDSVKKIYSTFASKYKISEETKPDYLKTINLTQNDVNVIIFSIDSSDRILYIEVYQNCVTSKNIGIGSKLKDVLKLYGKGKIGPTDEGYLVYFENMKGMSFLLKNQDIPKELRDIPDDVFTKIDENKILGLLDARIDSIKIYGIY